MWWFVGASAGTGWSVDITYEVYSSACVSYVDVLAIGGLRADFFFWGGRKQRISQVECWVWVCSYRTSIRKMDRTHSGIWFRFPVLSSVLLLSVQKVHTCPSAFRIFLFCGKWAQNKRGGQTHCPAPFLNPGWILQFSDFHQFSL